MKIRILILFISIFVVLASCKKDIIEPTIVPVNTSVKFSTDIYPLFASKGCTACHGASAPKANLSLAGTATSVRTNLMTVGAIVAGNATTSPLYTKFANGTTHNGGSFSAVESGNVKSWINLGALDN